MKYMTFIVILTSVIFGYLLTGNQNTENLPNSSSELNHSLPEKLVNKSKIKRDKNLELSSSAFSEPLNSKNEPINITPLCLNYDDIFNQKTRSRSIDINSNFPLKNGLPTPSNYNLPEYIRHQNILDYIGMTENSPLTLKSQQEIVKTYQSCEHWLQKINQIAAKNTSYTPLDKESYSSFKKNTALCNNLKNITLDHFNNEAEQGNISLYPNKTLHLQIWKLITNKQWEQLYLKIQNGEINKDYQYQKVDGIGIGKSVFHLAMISGAPKEVYSKLFELGMIATYQDISSATILSENLQSPLLFLQSAIGNGVNIFQYSVTGKNMFTQIAESPKRYKKLINFLHTVNFDGNSIYLSNQDPLATAISNYKKAKDNDTSLIELLLDKNAIVTPMHIDSITERKVENLLLDYQCQ